MTRNFSAVTKETNPYYTQGRLGAVMNDFNESGATEASVHTRQDGSGHMALPKYTYSIVPPS